MENISAIVALVSQINLRLTLKETLNRPDLCLLQMEISGMIQKMDLESLELHYRHSNRFRILGN